MKFTQIESYSYAILVHFCSLGKLEDKNVEHKRDIL